jgi:amidase
MRVDTDSAFASSAFSVFPLHLPATELVRLVQRGEVRASELVRAALQRIAGLDTRINAFQQVLGHASLQAAQLLEQRRDLPGLALAGLPIAVKDNLAIRGTPTRCGSAAVSTAPAPADHEIVRRVVAAGAILIGKTRMPELGLWGTTDGAWGITRNPWSEFRSPGGSSGGSAAAVAAGMVPVALGNDGLGSLRIPAACCGLFGLKPGLGLVPAQVSPNDWWGFTENGPLATTVEDAALLLSVIAEQRELADVREPDAPLRIALSTCAPGPGITIDPEHVRAAHASAQILRRAGHHVEIADPPYSTRFAMAVLGHWFQATALETATLDPAALESRTRTHARWGPLAERLDYVGPRWREEWRNEVAPLFKRFDVLLTPALAAPPPAAHAWAQRSWMSNLITNIRFAPFSAPWNLAGYPAASVPAGQHSAGTPIGIQLVGLPGRESVLLGLARTLERLQPWPRHAPRTPSL